MTTLSLDVTASPQSFRTQFSDSNLLVIYLLMIKIHTGTFTNIKDQ